MLRTNTASAHADDSIVCDLPRPCVRPESWNILDKFARELSHPPLSYPRELENALRTLMDALEQRSLGYAPESAGYTSLAFVQGKAE